MAGLTNGTIYTFTVTAANAVGSGPASAASNPVRPSANPFFVQQASNHAAGVSSLSLVPASNLTSGNRLVVLVGVWSSTNATAGPAATSGSVIPTGVDGINQSAVAGPFPSSLQENGTHVGAGYASPTPWPCLYCFGLLGE